MAKRKGHPPVDAETLEDEESMEDEFFDEDEENESDEDDDDLALDDDDEDVDDEPLPEEEAPEPFYLNATGYSDSFDWAALAEDELTKHQEVLDADNKAAKAIRISKLPVLHRWAAAQTFARLAEHDNFQKACQSILRARSKHEGLAVDEIYLELIGSLSSTQQFDDAFTWLEKFAKAYPDHVTTHTRVRALLLIEAGQIHEGKAILDQLIDSGEDKAEQLFEVGDDLVALGHPELALTFLERGKNIASRRKDTELITSIDESMRTASERIEDAD